MAVEVILYDLDINYTNRLKEIREWLTSCNIPFELEAFDVADFSPRYDTAFAYSFENPADAMLFKLRWT